MQLRSGVSGREGEWGRGRVEERAKGMQPPKQSDSFHRFSLSPIRTFSTAQTPKGRRPDCCRGRRLSTRQQPGAITFTVPLYEPPETEDSSDGGRPSTEQEESQTFHVKRAGCWGAPYLTRKIRSSIPPLHHSPGREWRENRKPSTSILTLRRRTRCRPFNSVREENASCPLLLKYRRDCFTWNVATKRLRPNDGLTLFHVKHSVLETAAYSNLMQPY